MTPVIWLTGLSGAGKTTIANALKQELAADGNKIYILDGDVIRRGLSRDLGYTDKDRAENIRRVGEVAKILLDAGVTVIVSMISPFSAEREMVKSLFCDHQFIEVFVDTPIEECIKRDTKGLYKRAFEGNLPNFTGISSPYELPLSPDVHLYTVGKSPRENAMEIITYIKANAFK
jgi:bifunctional enzyme CysN/CysC